MKPIIALGILLVALPAFAGNIVAHEIDSLAIAKNVLDISSQRHIEVYLPSGYDAGSNRYPVLYWLPGLWAPELGMENDINDAKIALDKAIQDTVIPATIVVFVEVHEESIVFLLNSSLVGNWEDFIVSELVPFIDKTYRTIPNAQGRALMGWSAGGYSAMLLAVLHPNIWGSIGMNDPAFWIMWSPLNDYKSDTQALKDLKFGSKFWFGELPQSLEGYSSFSMDRQVLLQKGASFSPNPNSPILSDMPVTPDGNKWVQEVWEKWSDYDLTEVKSLAKYSATLKKLSSIVIIIPKSMDSNRICNQYLLKVFQAAGISVTRLNMDGAHWESRDIRFVALAEQLLKKMQSTNH